MGVDLGWVDLAMPPGMRRLYIKGLDSFTDLLILRKKNEPRLATQQFWEWAVSSKQHLAGV